MSLFSMSNYSEGSNSIFFDFFSTFFQFIMTLLIYPTSIYFLCTPFNYNRLYGKYDTAFLKTRRIALQQANKMFLNNIVNTNRTTQKNNRNICLYIPKGCFLRGYFIFIFILFKILFPIAYARFLKIINQHLKN